MDVATNFRWHSTELRGASKSNTFDRGASVTLVGHKLCLYPAPGPRTRFKMTFLLDTKELKWTRIAIDNLGEFQGGHTASLIGTDLWFFGFLGDLEGFHRIERRHTEVFILDTILHEVRQIQTYELGPICTKGHTLYFYEEGNMLVMVGAGGMVGSGVLSALDLYTERWIKPKTTGSEPKALSNDHSSVLVGSRLFVFGAISYKASSIFILDLRQLAWACVDYGLSYRTGSAVCYAGGGRIFVYGGRNAREEASNDLFIVNDIFSRSPGVVEVQSGESTSSSAGFTVSRELPPREIQGHLIQTPHCLLLLGGDGVDKCSLYELAPKAESEASSEL